MTSGIGAGGGGGIRTHGTLRLSGFQDRRIRPLCHPSVNRFCQYLKFIFEIALRARVVTESSNPTLLHERTSLKKRSWDLRRFSNFRQSQDEAILSVGVLRAGWVFPGGDQRRSSVSRWEWTHATGVRSATGRAERICLALGGCDASADGCGVEAEFSEGR